MSTRPGTGGPKLRRLNMGQVFILLAVVSAVLTMVIFKNMMGAKSGPVHEAVKSRPVVVVEMPMFAGEIIKPENLKVVQWPDANYPSGEVYESSDTLVGRAVKTDLFPGQPIFRQNLAGEKSIGGLPVVIPKGYRAITILVTENKGVGGFIKPGDRVDIIGNFQYQLPEATQKSLSERTGALLESSISVTQTVLQDVQVLAIAQEMIQQKAPTPGAGAGAPAANAAAAAANPDEATKAKVVSSVTFAVTPEQAEKLSYADSKGDLRLSLRPDDEHEQVNLIGAVSNDVVPIANLIQKAMGVESSISGSLPSASSFADAAPVIPAPSAPVRTHDVEIIEGTSKNSVSF